MPSMRAYRFALLAALWIGAASCGADDTGPEPPDIETTTFAPSLGVDLQAMTKTATGLYWRDIHVGTGAQATTGSQITIQYTGWFVNGTQFDTNVGGNPLSFRIGQGQVIHGMDEGVRGMAFGGERQLIIPPSLGYGATGFGAIPGNAILVFRVLMIMPPQ